MKGIYVWVETSKQGTFLVRYQDPSGRHNKYAVEPAQEAYIDGERLVGKTLAKRLAKDWRDHLQKGLVGSMDPGAAVSPLVEQWLNEGRANNYSRETLNHSRNSLARFLEETDAKVLADLTRDLLVDWKSDMVEEDLALSTIRGRLIDVRTFLNWLVGQNKLAVSPFGKKMMPTKKGQEPKYYTTSEFMDLCAAMRQISMEGLLAITIAHDCGLRKVEMVGDQHDRGGVCHEDITWFPDGKGEMLLRREVVKGGARSRSVRLTPGVIELLGSRQTGQIVKLRRYQFDHYFRRAREMAKIKPDLNIHGLRHTFAKNCLQRGNLDLASLKTLLGHGSIVATEIYTQFEKSHLGAGVDRAYEERIQAETIVQRMQVVA